MTAAQRRSAIYEQLTNAQAPISATALAQQFSVSRQVVVGDIALLRAEGRSITATPRGYMIPAEDGLRRTIACHHSSEDTQRELYAMVDCGCTVVDVIVEHPVYGQLTAPLALSNRYDVQQFVCRMAESHAQPISALTGGVHLHTLSCPNEETFQHLKERLASMGMLYNAN
mgnify:CR=1 FL=1